MERRIRYDDYFDKVYGGWFGKCLGGASGALVEGVKGRIDVAFRDLMDPSLPNDDLDLQLLWLEQLEKKGPRLTGDDLASAWLAQCWYPFGEYGYFLRNYMQGIRPPVSGWFNNSFFQGGMGCPIRSEIWAMVSPGLPEEAVRLAAVDASLDHAGDSNWAEVFLAALESLAFFSSDIPGMVRQALSFVTEDCRFLRCAREVLEAHRTGRSFDEAVQAVLLRHAHPDFTNSVQNMGFTIAALLYGEGDMERTIDLALSCGYDADCTCASAAAVVGIAAGYRRIPEGLKGLMEDRFVCGIDVHRRDDTIRSLAEDTCRVGLSLAELLPGGSPIEAAPGSAPRIRWEAPSRTVGLEVAYGALPSIGRDGTCPVTVRIRNDGTGPVSATLRFEGLPDGWSVDPDRHPVLLQAGASAEIPAAFRTSGALAELRQTNLVTARLVDGQGRELASQGFGIAGARVFRFVAPFIEPMGVKPTPGHPPCHGLESALPPVEAMFSNQADPRKEYLDEAAFAANPDGFPAVALVDAHEDLIPIDEAFGIRGECTFYASTVVRFPEDVESWIVVGNTDAFRLWVNGVPVGSVEEIRAWQPQSHGFIVPFRKGDNTICLKLTRRTDRIRFSIGFRRYEGNHFHRMKWHADLASIVPAR